MTSDRGLILAVAQTARNLDQVRDCCRAFGLRQYWLTDADLVDELTSLFTAGLVVICVLDCLADRPHGEQAWYLSDKGYQLQREISAERSAAIFGHRERHAEQPGQPGVGVLFA